MAYATKTNKLIDELEKYYIDETGNDFAFLMKHDISKTEITTLVLLYDNCYYDIDASIEYFINNYIKIENIYNELYHHIKAFYEFYAKKIFGNIKHERFFDLCANIYLNEYRAIHDTQDYIKKCKGELYISPIKNTNYIDLISGFNFIHFYQSLCKDNVYYLIDKSMMTCKCLEIKKQESNIENIIILNKDIFDICRTDICGSISVVRAKNIWHYISNFDTQIEKFKSMIMQDGVFLFQEDSQNKLFFQQNNPYQAKNICSLFNNWKKELIIGTQNNKIFDSLVFRKMV